MNFWRVKEYFRTSVERPVSRRTGVIVLCAAAGLVAAVLPAARAAAPRSGIGRHHGLQLGLATWYGKQFHGHRTASGERFDMHAYTAAHRSLPLGSWIRVTNIDNKKSVLVRVNDRGPMSAKYVLDLSFSAAQALGMQTAARVRIDELRKDDPAVQLAAAPQPVMLPGAFASQNIQPE